MVTNQNKMAKMKMSACRKERIKLCRYNRNVERSSIIDGCPHQMQMEWLLSLCTILWSASRDWVLTKNHAEYGLTSESPAIASPPNNNNKKRKEKRIIKYHLHSFILKCVYLYLLDLFLGSGLWECPETCIPGLHFSSGLCLVIKPQPLTNVLRDLPSTNSGNIL